MDSNKRRFQRIPFDAKTELFLTSNVEQRILGSLRDISLKGALIVIDNPDAKLNVGTRAELLVRPEQGEFELSFTVEVAYWLSNANAIGLNIVSLDVDSAAHLRRLVEVNIGDESILQRELSNLVAAMEREHKN